MNRSLTRSFPIVTALVLAASPVAGQAIRGTVVDSVTRKPVVAAHVRVSVASGTPVGDTATDNDGAFTFRLPAPGDYLLRVSRPGYSTRVTDPISVGATFVAGVELRLVSSPVALDTLTVTAEKVAVEQQIPFLVDAGFYDRKHQGIGHFLTRADLDQHPSDRMTNAFQGISGVHVVCAQQTMPATCDVQAPGATTMFRRGVCRPSVVLDGVVLRAGGVLRETGPGQDPTVDQLLDPFNIEAVEVYTSSAGVPVQYKGYLSPCGAIIAWSRR